MSKTVDLKPTLTNEIQRKKLASSIMKNVIRIGNKMIAWVPVELLNIKEYQRSRQKHVTQIAENWDDSKCNVLLVSYDEGNGCFNVMDGQHRAVAARMRGVDYLVCEIFTGMTVSKEAAMFVEANVTSKKLNPFDTYKANQFITEESETELSKTDKRTSKEYRKYFSTGKLMQVAKIKPTVMGTYGFETSLFGTEPYVLNVNMPTFDTEQEAEEWILFREEWK